MIDFTKSSQYTLSIRINAEEFTFSIYNPMQDIHIAYEEKYKVEASLSLTANLKDAFLKTECLNYTYKRVNILIQDKRFTFIPAELYRKEDKDILFYQNNSKKDNETVLSCDLKRSDIVILFSIDKSLYDFLIKQMPEATFVNAACPLIDAYSIRSRLGNSLKMFVYLRRKEIVIYGLNKGKLFFANSFDCKQNNDRIYYILYIWKELKFDQCRDELLLTDTLSKDKNELLKELRAYIKQVTVMPNPFNDLQTFALCE